MGKTGAFSAISFSLLLWSCGGDDTPTTPTPTPVATSITLSATSLSFASLGETSQLSATVKDQNSATMSGASVTWASFPSTIASVSSTGLVTAIVDGQATITATSGSATGTAAVTVQQVADPAGGEVSLAEGAVNLVLPAGAVGETVIITAEPATGLPAQPVPITGTAFAFGPDGLVFAEPVTLTIGYDPADVPGGVPEEELRLHKLVGNVYVEVDEGVVDVVNNTVSGSIDGFSVFAILRRLSVTTSSPMPNGTVGVGYSETLAATGGDGSYTWALFNSTTLPAELTLNTGTGEISGTPTEAGTTNFEVEVTSAGQSATKALAINIAAGLTITTPTPMANGRVGVYYRVDLAATGGEGEYTWALFNSTTLPPGLVLEWADDGEISGTPTESGTTDFTFQVTSAGQTATKDLSITIVGQPIRVTEPSSSTVWAPGDQNVTIKWETGGLGGFVGIRLIKDGDISLGIISSTENDGSYSSYDVRVWMEEGTDYQVRVSYRGTPPDIFDDSDEFAISEQPPIIVTQPSSSTVWTPGDQNVAINWETGNLGGTVQIRLYKGSSSVETITSSTNNDGSYSSYDVPAGLTRGTDYRVRVYYSSARFDYSDYFTIAIPPCTYGILPTQLSLEGTEGALGTGARSVAVTTQPGCFWSVHNVPSWITIISSTSGFGAGRVIYTVDENVSQWTGSDRSALLTIAGKDFRVSQEAINTGDPQYEVLNPVTGFFRYGNWCGDEWSGGKSGGNVESTVFPVDSLDLACRFHDMGWASTDSDWQPKYDAAPLWRKPFVCADWFGDRVSDNAALFRRIKALPGLDTTDTPDTWGYHPTVFGAHDWSTIERRWAYAAIASFFETPASIPSTRPPCGL